MLFSLKLLLFGVAVMVFEAYSLVSALAFIPFAILLIIFMMLRTL